ARQAPNQHDSFDSGYRDRVGDARPNQPRDVSDCGVNRLIALPRRLRHAARVDARRVAGGQGGELRLFAFAHEFDSARGESGPARQCLQASSIPTAADGTVGCQRLVTDFAGAPETAEAEFSVEDHASADSGTKSEHEQVLHTGLPKD